LHIAYEIDWLVTSNNFYSKLLIEMDISSSQFLKAKGSTILLSATPHLDYLDSLRALAALYVLIHHAVLQVDIKSSQSVLVAVLALLFAHGRYAVDLFIVISGFSLMLPVVRNDGILRSGATLFFTRRAKRILPTYYVAMVISLLLALTIISKKTGTNWDGSIPVTVWDVVAHLFMIQDLFHDTIYKINHVFWSISVECHVYLFFPLLVVSWKKWGPMVTVLAVIAFSLVSWYVLAHTGLNVYGMSPHYLALFTFGMLAAQLSFAQVASYQVVTIAISAILAMIVHPILKPDLLMGSCSACLLVIVASGKLVILRNLLSWQPLTFLGSFAYSIYLVHAPLLQICSQYIIAPLNLSPLFAIVFFLFIGIPLILCTAYMFFLIAERPFINTKVNRVVKLSTDKQKVPKFSQNYLL
jgi:peptidoglycan/LPS O-acetylase OafA/YrhL